MTEQHRAKPEVWAAVERWSKNDMNSCNCTLELRSRVEALESAQRVIASPSSNRTHLGLTQDAPESSDSLVELVASVISGCGNIGPIKWWTPEARAAILAVADWCTYQNWHITAARLRQEAFGDD